MAPSVVLNNIISRKQAYILALETFGIVTDGRWLKYDELTHIYNTGYRGIVWCRQWSCYEKKEPEEVHLLGITQAKVYIWSIEAL